MRNYHDIDPPPPYDHGMMRRATGIPAGGLTKRRVVDLCRVAAALCRRSDGDSDG
jgi:hypothetical protein